MCIPERKIRDTAFEQKTGHSDVDRKSEVSNGRERKNEGIGNSLRDAVLLGRAAER